MSHPASPRVILVMGVTSSGKSTVGEQLAQRLNWTFRDADSFHPPENVAKMSSGQPLNDEDRKPWLAAIAAFIDASIRDLGFVPTTPISLGIPKFVAWYREFYGV